MTARRTGGEIGLRALAEALAGGDRRALARAITLVESSRAEDRAAADLLLQELLGRAGGALRLGISGAPGVGKSTFIESLGRHLIGAGRRIAVLAVDPSSRRHGGSILADKTRMERLARAPEAFIRPSPAGRTLGGVARRTHEALLLCEAAGFDVVIVETVGVGQSETAVSEMVDHFLLLLPPAGGDELQGLKKGVVEIADLLVVNKADGDLLAAARRAAAEYRSALMMLRPAAEAERVPLLLVSALEEKGIAEVWTAVERLHAALGRAGLKEKRAVQARDWLWREIEAGLIERFRAAPAVKAALRELEAEVMAGRLAPGAAAERLLSLFQASSGR